MTTQTTTHSQKEIIVESNTEQVSCNGGGALGHPLVWHSFDGQSTIECNYCNRLFTKNT